ncbi:MAG: hypothetical protein JWO53_944 [Chlamydiia bacterium]|nr:hypothetical protein [Chlamydiia bacterium]
MFPVSPIQHLYRTLVVVADVSEVVASKITRAFRECSRREQKVDSRVIDVAGAAIQAPPTVELQSMKPIDVEEKRVLQVQTGESRESAVESPPKRDRLAAITALEKRLQERSAIILCDTPRQVKHEVQTTKSGNLRRRGAPQVF